MITVGWTVLEKGPGYSLVLDDCRCDVKNRESQAWALRLFMASPPGVTSKTLRVWTRLRVCVYVCTSDEFCEDEEDSECREVKE